MCSSIVYYIHMHMYISVYDYIQYVHTYSKFSPNSTIPDGITHYILSEPYLCMYLASLEQISHKICLFYWILYHYPGDVGHLLNDIAETRQVHLLSVPCIGWSDGKDADIAYGASTHSHLLIMRKFCVRNSGITPVANTDSRILTFTNCSVDCVQKCLKLDIGALIGLRRQRAVCFHDVFWQNIVSKIN